MWWVVPVLASEQADCGSLGDAMALDAAIRAADQAIDALDPQGLQRASDALREAVRCRTAPLEVRQAAHVHRVLGVVEFVAGDEARSTRSFEASRALDPAAPLGHDIGGPLQSAWERAVPTSSPARTELPSPPRRSALVVDGQRLATRPTHLPYVLQLVDGDGFVSNGGLQAHDDPLPPWLAPDPEGPEPGRRRAPRFTVASLATGLASVGLLSGAAVTRARYNDLRRYDEDVEGLVPLNRRLATGGWVLGGGAVSLAAVAWFAGEW